MGLQRGQRSNERVDWNTPLRIVNTMYGAPMTVVETKEFVIAAERLMTGGVRKLRWALAGRGKRGGARVIYYFHSGNLPIVMLDIYAKNTKANLTMAERAAMKRRIPEIVRTLTEERTK